jgi:type I restriction enzyme S subunit
VVAPSDWKEIKVGDYAHITTGKKNTQDRMADGKYPFFVRSQNVERINSYSYDGEAVLTAGDGVGTGKVFHYINGKFDCHQRVYRITDFRSDLNGKFFYLLFSRLFYDRIMSMTAKSSVDSVRMEMISEMELVIPSSIREQELIAEALSDADAAIESLDALITKKRDVKQATMQQLLTGRTRMPGFTVDWKKTELRSVLKFQVGFPFSSQSFAPNGIGIRLIRNADLKSASSAVSIVGAYPEEFAVQSGDLLIGMDGDFAPIIWKGGLALLNQRVGRVICGPEMNKGYARYELASHLKEIEIRTGATTVKHLSHDDVASIVLKLPPLKEQEAIAEALSAMDDELEALTEQVSKLRMVKEGMMQDLLTGKVRLV